VEVVACEFKWISTIGSSKVINTAFVKICVPELYFAEILGVSSLGVGNREK
jgi:hypothetical protein